MREGICVDGEYGEGMSEEGKGVDNTTIETYVEEDSLESMER